MFAEHQPTAVQSRLECLRLDLENGARLFGRQSLNVAQDDRHPVDGRELRQRLISRSRI